ncbi:hypothetical protein Goari_012034, partial [Gossypium aridum]|nr:hypothetical protein [Gossypium aridum]
MRVRVQIDIRKPLKRKKQDLSLRAQSRRALSMNSIWLREEGKRKWEESWTDNRVLGLRSWDGDTKERRGKAIDPILGFNIEGGVSSLDQRKDKSWSNRCKQPWSM